MSGRHRLGVLLGVVLAFASAAPSRADEQPSILKTYALDWIERVREEAWPGPKEQRPVICLLDTGVAVTPDTPADSPAGPIVARLAVDGGTGLPQGTQPLQAHGTQMAAVMAAPRNDWGTVGVFPQARIVSVRVTEGAETHITPEAMRLGAQKCIDWTRDRGVRMSAVVMAESNYDQRASDGAGWQAVGSRLLEEGSILVAAAGNQTGAELPLPPLGIDSVLAVGAGNGARGRCAFTPAGFEPTAWAPGCDAPGWPSGTSVAAAVTGAAVAAVATRTGSPAVAVAAELRADGGVVDGAGALARHFAGVVDAPISAVTAGVSDTETRIVSDDALPVARVLRLWRPKARASWSRGRLQVSVAGGVPAAGRVWVRIGSSKMAGPAGRKRFTIQRKRRPVRVELWVEGQRPEPWRSMLLKTRVARS